MLHWQHHPALCALAVASAGIVRCLHGTFVPASQFWGRVLTRSNDRSSSAIALTFDDGPTDGPTQRVLEILGQLEIPATFFVIGRNARRKPHLLRDIRAAGHVIGNHSWDHAHFALFRGWGYWREQLAQTNAIIEDTIGQTPAMFRPPMGIHTPPILGEARRAGMVSVNWSRRAGDGVDVKPQTILRRLGHATGGEVLLLHDGIDPCGRQRGPAARDSTIAALPMLISALRDRGLRFLPLHELLGVDAYQRQPVAAVT